MARRAALQRAAGPGAEAVFGAVTTGSVWRFIRLRGDVAEVDLAGCLGRAGRCVAGVLAMLAEGRGPQEMSEAVAVGFAHRATVAAIYPGDRAPPSPSGTRTPPATASAMRDRPRELR